MHAFGELRNPSEASIEQICEWAQAVAGEGTPHTTLPHEHSSFAVDLGPPPADADEEKTPVAEQFGRLALKGMADELKDPSDDE